jgi:hypothetical protein
MWLAGCMQLSSSMDFNVENNVWRLLDLTANIIKGSSLGSVTHIVMAGDRCIVATMSHAVTLITREPASKR